ncbi:MAG: type II 3-dehydroquinate dehydratase [Rhodospirillaceae bacterium]|jgi:3-dehydroquinate dehydratase II|nr:type II 3-dehydroquinate dehydratase [Rhodospirillaceae bacterium]MBT6202796.1 type II 3-dehydroquinate dehydratase [Rhodospirillaceae bacterium]MBT7614986.1 type II 3-dehydroquinate dehydratase [Rhodospirillaceae bacterium]
MAATVFILNGPNLNLLGEREPEIYGREPLADIEARARSHAVSMDLEIDFRQSNHEGALIDAVHEARGKAVAVIVNAGGLTHTSVALLDALNAFDGIVVEVHLSNIHRREEFRHHSYVAAAATGSICGFGSHGYIMALDAVHNLLERASA